MEYLTSWVDSSAQKVISHLSPCEEGGFLPHTKNTKHLLRTSVHLVTPLFLLSLQCLDCLFFRTLAIRLQRNERMSQVLFDIT